MQMRISAVSVLHREWYTVCYTASVLHRKWTELGLIVFYETFTQCSFNQYTLNMDT